MRSALVASILAIADPAAADDDPCAVVEPAATPAAATVDVRGKIVGKKTGEALAGAVIAFTSGSLTGEAVVIADETGQFSAAVPRGTYTMTVYFLDATETIKDLRVTETTWLGTTQIDDSKQSTGCVFWTDHHSPDLASVPRFGFHASRTEPIIVSRDRTHRAWLAPAAAADPATAVVTLNGGARLQSAPGVPVAFLEDSSVHTLRVPFETAGGSGGAAELSLRSGSNKPQGDTRLVLGADRDGGMLGGVEALASGPLKQDKAWIAGGVVANRNADATVAADAMVRANVAFSIDHQLAVTGMHQAHGDTTDSWADTQWVSKFLDAKLQITGAFSAEQLALPGPAAIATQPLASTIDRAGGTVGARLRYKGAGYHAFGLGVAAGGGQRGGDEHRDATIVAGDHWQIKPNLELHAGVRADTRVFDGRHTSVTSPRVDLSYDPTQEGRSEVFVAYQRVSRLDDGLPGDWRTLPHLFRDEVAVGAAWLHQSFELPMVGIAARTRWAGNDRDERETGIDAWLRHERRETTLHLGVTTVGGRVATMAAQRRLVDRARDDIFAAATVRASADRTEGGGALVWRHSGATTEVDAKDDLSFDLALEGHGGTDGPGGRLLLGISW